MNDVDMQQLLKLLQSAGSGLSGVNDGLISLKNKEKANKYNGIINGAIDTGIA
jgi:hypothetical protein